MNRFLKSVGAIGAAVILVVSCNKDKEEIVPGITLTSVATAQVQWTGLAVSKENKLFACFPRMNTDTVPYSVAVINGDQATPFPNADWNTWNKSLTPQDHFICVQSVYTDDQNNLWVLDPASPLMQGVVQGGAKLMKFNPATGELLQRIIFDDPTIVYETSYLNDVRVDTQKNVAYITDSGQGAIIVVNLTTGKARRLLSMHPTTKSEGTIITVEGRIYRTASGKIPSTDADGIALRPQRDYLYWHALTGRSLYRVPTAALLDESLNDSQIAQRIEGVSQPGPCDGMIFDAAGNLYLTSVEENAITRLTPGGKRQVMAQDAQLKWPDSFSIGPDSALYVTTSQLHIPKTERTEPFRILKINLK